MRKICLAISVLIIQSVSMAGYAPDACHEEVNKQALSIIQRPKYKLNRDNLEMITHDEALSALNSGRIGDYATPPSTKENKIRAQGLYSNYSVTFYLYQYMIDEQSVLGGLFSNYETGYKLFAVDDKTCQAMVSVDYDSLD